MGRSSCLSFWKLDVLVQQLGRREGRCLGWDHWPAYGQTCSQSSAKAGGMLLLPIHLVKKFLRGFSTEILISSERLGERVAHSSPASASRQWGIPTTA